jgi:hypothetical protein
MGAAFIWRGFAMHTAIPLTVLATALACSLATTPVNARARVFVASYGNDENPCTFGSPCKTFQQAVNVVDAGGEVTAIDSAGFGPISIGKSVTITSPPGVEAGIVPNAGNDAIDILAGPTDTIVLRGLTLQGGGSGLFGINAVTGGNLEIVDCAIRGFRTAGIFADNQSAQMSVAILNTLVADTPLGIQIGTNAGAMLVAMDGVKVNNNSNAGIFLSGNPGFALEVSIANSRIDNAGSTGLSIQGFSPTLAVAYLRNVTITQTPIGINLNGNSVIYLSQVQQQEFFGFTNVAGIKFGGTGNVAFSDSTNHIQGSLDGGSLTSWAFQ